MTSLAKIEANRRNAQKSTGPKTEKGKARSKRNAVKHGLRSIEILTPDENPEELDELREELKADLAPVGRLELELVEQIAASFWRLRRCRRVESGLLLSGEKVISRNLYEGMQVHLDALCRKDGDTIEERLENASTADLFREIIHLRANDVEAGLPPEKAFWSHMTGEELFELYQEANKEEQQRNPLTYDVGLAFSDKVSGPDEISRLSRYETAISRQLHRDLHELQRLQARRKGDPSSPPAALDVDVTIGRK